MVTAPKYTVTAHILCCVVNMLLHFILQISCHGGIFILMLEVRKQMFRRFKHHYAGFQHSVTSYYTTQPYQNICQVLTWLCDFRILLLLPERASNCLSFLFFHSPCHTPWKRAYTTLHKNFNSSRQRSVAHFSIPCPLSLIFFSFLTICSFSMGILSCFSLHLQGLV